MRQARDCERLLENKRGEALAAEVSAKDIMTIERGFSVSKAFLCKKDDLAVLPRQMTVGLLQDVFCVSKAVQKHFEHSVFALHGLDTERRVGKMARSAERDLCWCTQSRELLRPIGGLIQTYSDKTATSLMLNALVPYRGHVTCLSSTAKKRRHTVEQGHTLLGILPAGAVKLRENNGAQDVDKTMLMHGSASSERVALEDVTPMGFWTTARRERLKLLGQAMPPHL